MYGGWTEIFAIMRPLCDSEARSVNAQRDITLHTLDLTVRVTPRAEHMRHRLLGGLRPCQCLLFRVSNLLMFADARAGLPTAVDGRGSCPARASISLTRASRKSLWEIFFSPHVDSKM